MSVLIMRTSALGDVAMTIPAVYSVAQQNPSMDFVMLTDKRFAPMFVRAPRNLRFLPYDRTIHHGMKGLWRLLRMLSHEDIQKVADLHNVLRSWIVDAAFLIKGRKVRMLDKGRRFRKGIVSSHSPSKEFTLRYFDVFRRLGFSIWSSFDQLNMEGVEPPEGTMGEKVGERWIGIAPFARYTTKIFPTERMENIVRKLSTMEGVRLFLFGGGKEETAILQRWASTYPHTHIVTGKGSLDHELAAMQRLDVMVSMDSANMHLASLVGVRVVSIWGGTTPECGFIGWHQSDIDAIVSRVACQPCSISGNKRCRRGDMLCMNSLNEEFIIDKIMDKE